MTRRILAHGYDFHTGGHVRRVASPFPGRLAGGRALALDVTGPTGRVTGPTGGHEVGQGVRAALVPADRPVIGRGGRFPAPVTRRVAQVGVPIPGQDSPGQPLMVVGPPGPGLSRHGPGPGVCRGGRAGPGRHTRSPRGCRDHSGTGRGPCRTRRPGRRGPAPAPLAAPGVRGPPGRVASGPGGGGGRMRRRGCRTTAGSRPRRADRGCTARPADR
jgi:hypothetical protein